MTKQSLMKKLSVFALVAAFAGFAWLSLPGPDQARTPGASQKTTSGSGLVQSIDKERGVVTIKHGPLPALNMMAMTMSYVVKDKSQLANLQPLQKVEFELSYDGNENKDPKTFHTAVVGREKHMHHLSRRKFLTTLAGAGVTGLGGPFWRHEPAFAAVDAGRQTAPAPASAALPAGQFTNRLRLPGASGLYAAVAAKDVKQITVSELNFEVLPKISSPFLAYVAEVGGKRFLNPTLLARPGDQIKLRMVNQLKRPTIIHWHGMTNDERNDGFGNYQVGSGKSFDYAFTVRDRAANYWYHPHPHDIAGEQAYRGLAGLLIVKDDDEEKLSRALDLTTGVTDIPLVIQDRSFNFEGKLEYKLSRDQLSAGFFGEEILVNLAVRPYFDASRRIYRFRILNGSNARSYRLAFAQGTRLLDYYLIGTDGGLLEGIRSATAM